MTLDSTGIPDDMTTPHNSVESNFTLIMQQRAAGNLSKAQTRLSLSALFGTTPQSAVTSTGPIAEVGVGLARAKAVVRSVVPEMPTYAF
jgi:hypothetical protein